MISFNKISAILAPKYSQKLQKTPVYRLKNDVFEHTIKAGEISIMHMNQRVHISSKPLLEKLKVRFNPENKTVIFKKVKDHATGKLIKTPCEVYVAESVKDGWQTTYHFIEKDLKTEAGYVTIDDWSKLKKDSCYWEVYENSALLDNYPELGITGKRVSIEYLQNNNEELYAGIGAAADQIAVEYCLKNGFKPNITSVADYESHIAHYNRGRRFFEISKNDIDIDAYEFLEQFGTLKPDKIIEKRIAAAKSGERIDTSDLGALHMYMPQEIIQKYLQKIAGNRILKADF